MRLTYVFLGVAFVVTVVVATAVASGPGAEVSWITIGFGLFATAATEVGRWVERRNRHAVPRAGAGWHAASAALVAVEVGLGTLLLLAAFRVGAGRPIAGFLDRLYSAWEAVVVLLGIGLSAIVWAGMGLTGVIGALVNAARAAAGRPIRTDAIGWKHGIGGAALLVAIGFAARWLAQDAAWLREQLNPLADLVGR